jgi:hemerythrin-like metal-binding protein
MALIEWQPQFAIGIPAIDHEHREMIELINRLHASLADDAPKADIDDFLGEVHSDISAHFALEEKTMRDMAYGEYDAHKADHERLLDDIRDIMDAFDADAYFDYSESLSQHLKRWFTEHFRTMDSRLHHHFRDHA